MDTVFAWRNGKSQQVRESCVRNQSLEQPLELDKLFDFLRPKVYPIVWDHECACNKRIEDVLNYMIFESQLLTILLRE